MEKYKISEKNIRSIIKETLISYFYEPNGEFRNLPHLSLLTEKGESNVSLGLDTTEEFIYENINEGMIMSYDINKSAKYLKAKFPNIVNVRSLKYNPYKKNSRTKENEFVAIDLGNNFTNYKEIIAMVQTLLGWFASAINLREKTKAGFIPRIFNNFNGIFECDDFAYIEKYNGNDGFENYLNEHEILAFSIIIEAKYGKLCTSNKRKYLYHATDYKNIKRICKQGLVPRSNGNFPERIYLGSSISEIKKMVGANLQDIWMIKINVEGIKLYHDERERTAYYTYDNISPDKIVKIYQISMQ